MVEVDDDLRAVLGHMRECVSVYAHDSRIEYLNPAAEDLLGRTLKETAGKRLWDLLPEAVGGPFWQAFQRVAAGGPAETFDLYDAARGRWFTNHVERVGERVHVVARDVTGDVRRRRRLEALARVFEVLGRESLGLDEVLQGVAEALSQVLEAECRLALLSDDRAWLELAATASAAVGVAEPPPPRRRRWAADIGHCGRALRTRSTVLAPPSGVELDLEYPSDPELRAAVVGDAAASLLVAPLLFGDEAIGVLLVSRLPGSEPLTADDRALIADIAPGVGLYLAHARRRTETALLRDRLAAVSDSSPALVAFIDRENRYRYVNAAYERWYRRPRGDFLGRRVVDLVPPGVWDVIAPHVHLALEGAQTRFRAALDYPSGVRHVEVHYEPIRGSSGEVEGFASTVIDRTAEVRFAEQEHRRLEFERRATRRLESLLAVTGRLAGADSEDEIARVVVDEGVDALDADLAGLWLCSPDGELILQRHRGLTPAQVAAAARLPRTGDSPQHDCITNRRSVFVESRADYAARYPQFELRHRQNPATPVSFAMLPLMIEGQAVGCFNFTFRDERCLTDDEKAYLEVLASHVAEALRRARLYAALRDASETRQAVIQASPAAIMLLGAEGIVLSWNSAATRIFGWTAEEVIGRPLPTVAEGRHAEFLADIAQVLAGQQIEGRPGRRRRKSGELVDVEVYAAPVRLSSGRTMCLSMVFDVAERTRLERGRRLVSEASAILASSLELADTLAQVVRLPVREHAEGCAVVLEAEGGPVQRIVEGLDPATCDPTATLTVPLSVGGRVLGSLSIAARNRKLDDLDRAVVIGLASHAATAIHNARLYQEARSARREAEAASRAKDQFLAMLGHELRNPLAPITTALHLMRVRTPGQAEHEREVIERQVAHLSRLVDDLLDVSRITRGKIELRQERTPVETVVAKAIETTSPLFEARRHRISVDVPEDLAVLGDPMRLAQVVANLLSNAAKYTECGGHILVSARHEADEIALVVRDDGIGISPDMLPTIFDMFTQAPQPSARPEGGLGLGLAIVRSLVEMHGGRVSAHSDGQGTGTEFRVVLPAVREPVESPSGSWGPRVVRTTTCRRVLVVDDNEDAAAMLGEVLGAYGHEIRTAFDGPSALQAAAEFLPEIAVLDIGLPVMDGYELAERLRTLPGLDALRLIAVSGYGQESDRIRSLAAGFDAHLAKPVAIDSLLGLLAGDHEG